MILYACKIILALQSYSDHVPWFIWSYAIQKQK